MFQYDDASGDEDPLDGDNERFNTLFGDRRFEFGPTGIYGPFNRSNLESPRAAPHVHAEHALAGHAALPLVSPRRGARHLGRHRRARRDRSAGDSLGRQLEGSVTWTAIEDRLTLEGGVAHLWFGRFADQTGLSAGGDPNFFYAVATTRF